MRLVEEDCSYCSYGEAYEVNCARYGREVDTPIVAFKRKCCNAQGQLMLDPDNHIRLGVRPPPPPTCSMSQSRGRGAEGS